MARGAHWPGGSSFQEGTTIISGADGNALVVFSNGASIKIVPNTELEIAKFEQAAFDEKIEGFHAFDPRPE